MPRRLDDRKQPEIAPTAGDLGLEAYRANLADHDGVQNLEDLPEANDAVPAWKQPKIKRRRDPGTETGEETLRLGDDYR